MILKELLVPLISTRGDGDAQRSAVFKTVHSRFISSLRSLKPGRASFLFLCKLLGEGVLANMMGGSSARGAYDWAAVSMCCRWASRACSSLRGKPSEMREAILGVHVDHRPSLLSHERTGLALV